MLHAGLEVRVQLAVPAVSGPVMQLSVPSVSVTAPYGFPDPLIFATVTSTVYPCPTRVAADRSVVIVVVVLPFGVRAKFLPGTGPPPFEMGNGGNDAVI